MASSTTRHTTAMNISRDIEPGLKYTLAALGVFLLVGLIVVPMSMPESEPPLTASEKRAETFLSNLDAVVEHDLAVGQVVARYGVDGGVVCRNQGVAARRAIATKIKGTKRTVITPAQLTESRVAIQTYCPENLAAWDKAGR